MKNFRFLADFRFFVLKMGHSWDQCKSGEKFWGGWGRVISYVLVIDWSKEKVEMTKIEKWTSFSPFCKNNGTSIHLFGSQIAVIRSEFVMYLASYQRVFSTRAVSPLTFGFKWRLPLADLMMYWHENAPECTKLILYFQNFPGGHAPEPP